MKYPSRSGSTKREPNIVSITTLVLQTYLKNIFSHISIDTVGLFFSPEFLYPTMVAENFRIFGVQIIGKCICGSKNESRHFDQYLQEKLFTWFLSPISEGNYSFFLARLFSKIYFPPKEMWELLADDNTVCGSLCSFHVL